MFFLFFECVSKWSEMHPRFWSNFTQCPTSSERCTLVPYQTVPFADYGFVNWHHHTIIRAAFVCLCVCSLSPPRSFDGSSPNLVGVCRWTSHLPLRGSFSKRSTARRVNGSLSLSTILYMHQPHATQLQRRFLLAGSAAESNSATFAAASLRHM